MISEVEDFEAFLEPGFDPLPFASSLLLATNVADDNELDLGTPIKKLQFDALECDKRMEKLASVHYDQLIDNFSKIESTRTLMAQNINPLVERVKKSYSRISSDVVTPYEEAVTLNAALKRVHSTLRLLRGAGFFIVFVQQLQDCELALEALNDNRDVVRLASLHRQISDFYTKTMEDGEPDLLSLKLVRDFQPMHQVKTANLASELTSKISNDLGHHSSFHAQNEVLQNNLLALYTLDSSEVFSVLENGAISKSVQVSLTLLTRSLQSPRNFNLVLGEIKQSSSLFVSTLSALLDNCRIPNANSKTLLEQFQRSNLDGNDIEHVYWTRLAHKFKKNIAVTMARGGPIARNLKTYAAGITTSIQSVFEGTPQEVILDAVSIIGN